MNAECLCNSSYRQVFEIMNVFVIAKSLLLERNDSIVKVLAALLVALMRNDRRTETSFSLI